MSDNQPAPSERPSFDPDGVDVALDLVAGLASMMPSPKLGPAQGRPRRSARQAGNLQPVGDVVGQVASEFGWQGRISLHLLQTRWPTLVGDLNASHSRPIALNGTVVVVRADSSTWASALRLIAAQLVAKLNQAIGDGAVTRVDVQGPEAPNWKHGPRAVTDGRGPRDTYG